MKCDKLPGKYTGSKVNEETGIKYRTILHMIPPGKNGNDTVTVSEILYFIPGIQSFYLPEHTATL
jgi:hypothetical protein